MSDVNGTENPPRLIAVLGGVYSNHIALQAVLTDARRQGAEAIYCLGDVGGFGPPPDRAIDIFRASGVQTIQGNYDDSVGNALGDCQCGYTDPRDNHYARISYDYTLANTSAPNRRWLRELRPEMRVRMGGRRLLLAHGSPRRTNEFLWESTTPVAFIRRLLDENDADILLLTHTGLPWSRFLPEEPSRGLVNVGAVGRPANDGDPAVHYAVLRAANSPDQPLQVEPRRVEYDHEALAREMRDESLPEEFVETIRTGWWTTCLEILPAKERGSGRF